MFEDSSSTPHADVVSVTSFTISTSFDTHRGGTKHTHFVSMNFEVQPPHIGPARAQEEIAVLMVRGSLLVSKECIKQALVRGQMTVDEANEHIAEIESNHLALLEKAESKFFEGFKDVMAREVANDRLTKEGAVVWINSVKSSMMSSDEAIGNIRAEIEEELSKQT